MLKSNQDLYDKIELIKRAYPNSKLAQDLEASMGDSSVTEIFGKLRLALESYLQDSGISEATKKDFLELIDTINVALNSQD